MAHRQAYRKGPATAISSMPTPASNHDGDNTYQDSRDIQQVADDSIAFLRTFSLRLQRYRAQVGEFAHADQPPLHTDGVPDDDFPKPTPAMPDDATRPNEPLEIYEKINSRNEHETQPRKPCEECEPSHTELPDIKPQSPTVQTNRIPPCLKYAPDQPTPKDTYITTRRFGVPPSLRGTYVDEYLKQAYTTVELVRDDPHPYNQPIVIGNNGDDADDEFNNGLDTAIDRPMPCEPETLEGDKVSAKPTGDMQRTVHKKQENYNSTPPRQSGPEPVALNRKRTKLTTDSRIHSADVIRNCRTDPIGHKKAPTTTLIAKETEKTVYNLIRTQDTTERDIEGLVPDRGKKPSHRTGRVSVNYTPT